MATITEDPTNVIDAAVEHFSEQSYKEKVNPGITQEVIDTFLDTIIELRNLLDERSSKLEEAVEMLESLTWIEIERTSENLMKVNDLITKIRDFTRSLNRQLFLLKDLKNKGIATSEINRYRDEVRALGEAADDLDSNYFILPSSEDFIEDNRIISLV